MIKNIVLMVHIEVDRQEWGDEQMDIHVRVVDALADPHRPMETFFAKTRVEEQIWRGYPNSIRVDVLECVAKAVKNCLERKDVAE